MTHYQHHTSAQHLANVLLLESLANLCKSSRTVILLHPFGLGQGAPVTWSVVVHSKSVLVGNVPATLELVLASPFWHQELGRASSLFALLLKISSTQNHLGWPSIPHSVWAGAADLDGVKADTASPPGVMDRPFSGEVGKKRISELLRCSCFKHLLRTALRNTGLGRGIAGQRLVVGLFVGSGSSGSRCGFTSLGCSGHRTGVLQGDSSIHFGGVVFVDASHQGWLLVLGNSGEDAELAIHLQNGGPLVLQATFLCLNRSYIQIVGCSGLLIARSILLTNRLWGLQNLARGCIHDILLLITGALLATPSGLQSRTGFYLSRTFPRKSFHLKSQLDPCIW